MTHQALAFILVFTGGGLGAVLRHAVNQASAAFLGVAFPYGTLLVNIIGSFAIGLLAGWLSFRADGGTMLRLFFATGVLGGFTTFSAFSLDAALLWERGETMGAVLYVGASVTCAILGVFGGLYIMRSLLAVGT